MLASREDLSCSIKPELRSGGEIMVCELKIPGFPKIAVIAAYRPPDDSSSFIPFLFSTLTKVESSGYSHLLLFGDLNFPQIDWQLTSSSHELGNQFCNLLDDDFSLTQLIEDPTHIHGNILDFVATNFPESLTKPVCSNSVVNSDHQEVYFEINIKGSRKHRFSRVCYNYNKADLRTDLSNANLKQVLDMDDISSCWSSWLSIIFKCINAG